MQTSSQTTNISEYEKLIIHYSNRIIHDKRVSIENYTDTEGKLIYSIKFFQPEWFTELDNDIQCNIVNYLQFYYKDVIEDLFKDYNNLNLKKRKIEEVTNFDKDDSD